VPQPNVTIVRTGTSYEGLSLAYAAALDGDVLEMDTGTHSDALTVTKALTFRPRSGQTPILGAQIILNSDVGITVDGLTIATGTAAVKTKYNGGAYAVAINITRCNATSAATLLDQNTLSQCAAVNVTDNTGTLTQPIVTGRAGDSVQGTIARNNMTCLGDVGTGPGEEVDVGALVSERNILRINGSLTAAALKVRLVSGTLTCQQNTYINTDSGTSWRPYNLITSSTWTGSCLCRGNVYIGAQAAGTFTGTGTNEFATGSGYSTFSHAAANPGRAGDETVAAASMGFVDLGAGNYDLAAGSPLIDTATGCTSVLDVAGRVSPQREGPDRGAYEYPNDAPTVTGCELAEARTSLQVNFSAAMTAATINTGGEWSVTSSDGGTAATVASVSVDGSGLFCILTFSPTTLPTPGKTYTVTAPATATDYAANLIASGGRSASFAVPALPVAVPPAPVLRVTFDGSPLESFGMLPEDGEPDVYPYIRAAWLSLFCDAPAQEGDALPDPSGDAPYLGGWWGDTHASVAGDAWGARLWLLSRTRDPDAPARAVEYAQEALAWMLTDGILSAPAEVSAARDGDRLDLSVRLRFATNRADLAFNLWGV